MTTSFVKRAAGWIAATLLVFVSGWMLGKIDGLANHILSPEVLLKPMAAFRAVAFVAAVLLAALITRTFRV